MELVDSLLPPLITLFEAISPLITALMPIIKTLAEIIGNVLGGAIDAVMPVINGLLDILTNVIDFITGVFTGDWEKAWDAVVGIFKGIFNLIPGIVEAVINGAISVINGIIDGINALTGVFGIGEIGRIPSVSLPRFHVGGIVDFSAGEGTALLKDGEMVLTQAQQKRLFEIANSSPAINPLESISALSIGMMGPDIYGANSISVTVHGDAIMDGRKVGNVVYRNIDSVVKSNGG